MEKRVNYKVENYISELKKNICSKISSTSFDDTSIQNDLLEYIYDYDRLILTNEDFIKRKRIKNTIPTSNRCTAKRANGEQCTRRRKTDCEFCGTHEKGRPHGLVDSNNTNDDNSKTVEVIAYNIMGIVYYIDNNNNVYDTEDIMNNKKNPRIICKAEKVSDNTYIIPVLGLC